MLHHNGKANPHMEAMYSCYSGKTSYLHVFFWIAISTLYLHDSKHLLVFTLYDQTVPL